MELQGLDYTVYHKPGTQMGCVDGLSRLPVAALMYKVQRHSHPCRECTSSSQMFKKDVLAAVTRSMSRGNVKDTDDESRWTPHADSEVIASDDE